MEVTKEEYEFGASYYLTQDDKCLRIIYGGNLDLYWYFFNKKSRRENTSSIKDVYESMLITKENYTIYSLFERLISETREGKVYLPDEIELEPTFYDTFDIRDIYDVDPFAIDEEDEVSLTEHYRNEESERMNKRIQNSFAYQELTKNNSITWHSDDAPLEYADMVKITEVEEGILLEFTRPNIDITKVDAPLPGTLSIRFSNSGSRYGELVTIFTRMYNRLTEYEPIYHQIHIEEIEHQKRLLLEKKDK